MLNMVTEYLIQELIDETLKRLKEGIIEPPIDYIEAQSKCFKNECYL